MELHSLKDRLQVFQRNHEKTTGILALIESLRANIPQGILLQHDRLQARGRRSVAEVRRGVCLGCHLRMPTGQAAALMRGDTVQRCQTCGRFLYWVEEDEETPSTTSAPGKQFRGRRVREEALESRVLQ